MPYVSSIFVEQSQKECTSKLGLRACQAVWYLCAKLDCNTNGVPTQTCRIIEKYITYLVKRGPHCGGYGIQGNKCRIVDYCIAQDLQDGHGYPDIMYRMRSQFFLIASGAMWLAAKMSSASAPVSASIIWSALTEIHNTLYCTLQEVKSMEIEVMLALASNVPLFTIDDMVNHLAMSMEMDTEYAYELYRYTRLMEMDRRHVDRNLHSVLKARSINERPRVLTVDYAAGIVAAVIRANTHVKTGTATKLAELIGVSPKYVKCLRDVFLAEFAVTVPTRPSSPYSVANRTRSRARSLMATGRDESLSPEPEPPKPRDPYLLRPRRNRS